MPLIAFAALLTTLGPLAPLDDCLIRAANELRRHQPNLAVRYRTYAQACGDERAQVVATLLDARGSFGADTSHDDRVQNMGVIIRAVDERYTIWAIRCLETRYYRTIGPIGGPAHGPDMVDEDPCPVR